MATLTWRNVDAPDFRGTADALRMSHGMLGNAFEALQQGLTNFEARRNRGTDNALMLAALQYDDPQAYQAALQSGQLVNPANVNSVSPDTLDFIGRQRSTLINQQGTLQDQGIKRYAQDRTVMQDTNRDAARDAVNTWLSAAATGNPELIARAQQAATPYVSQLSLEDQGKVFGDVRSGETGSLTNTGRRIDQGIQVRDDTAEQQAMALANEIRRAGGTTDGARGLLESINLPQNVRYRVNELLGSTFGDIYAPVGSDIEGFSGGGGRSGGAGASAPGTAGTRQGNPYDTTYTFAPTSQPITSMPIQDVLGLQQQYIRDKGHSPMGAFQINRDTLTDFAPKVLGENWRDQPFTPEVQDRIGEAIFNARKNGNLKGTWAALPDATPGAYKDRTWEEMRSLIAEREVGQPLAPASARAAADAASLSIQTRNSQNLSSGIAADFGRAVNDRSTVGEVVTSLLENDFQGTNRGFLTGQVNRIMEQTGQNAAVAGAILRRSVTEADDDGGIPSLARITRNMLRPANTDLGRKINEALGTASMIPESTPNLGNGIRLDNNTLKANIESVRRLDPVTESLAAREIETRDTAIQSAREQYNAARQRLQAFQQRVQTQPRLAAQLPQVEAAFMAAESRLRALLAGQRNDPNLQPIIR